MKPQVYYRKNGSMFMDSKLASDYVIKIPTKANRLNKSGSAGLKMAEKYDLEHNKKGILYVDQNLRAYVILPKELLMKPVGKSYNGVKNTIFSYDVNSLVNEHNLELVSIPKEDEIVEPHKQGLAAEIRRKFGL